MSDATQTRLSAFRYLETLITQSNRLNLAALQKKDLDDQDYAAIVAQYRTWFTACLTALPADLHQAFRDPYDDEPLNPKLAMYLIKAREPNSIPKPEKALGYWSPWKYDYNMRFERLVMQQQQVLQQYRQRLLDIPSLVPHELKQLFANIFSGKHYSVVTIDGMFSQAGAQQSWWIAARSSPGGKPGRALGWFDGILLHAPEREKAIIESVCRAALRNGMTDSATAARMTALLPESQPIHNSTQAYIAPERIQQLRDLQQSSFDFTRLIRLCEELNGCMSQDYYIAAAMLTRAILDHVPPIFDATSFSQTIGQHGTRSFKEAMQKLDDAVRKIADGHLHTLIRQREVLPTRQQVDVGTLLDVLLAEIVRILK